jgi:predicted HAD superfamily Cof-like phosphohydrolase
MSVVREFHEAFGHPAPPGANIPSVERAALRFRLVTEEFAEVREEFAKLLYLLRTTEGNHVEVHQLAHTTMQNLIKELTDLVYVCEGAQIEFGVDPDAAMREVHQSNMSKLGTDGKPIYDAGGKVMKGPDYRPVDPERLFPGIIDIPEEDIHDD